MREALLEEGIECRSDYIRYAILLDRASKTAYGYAYPRDRVYEAAFPVGGAVPPTALGGDDDPAWGRQHLFYSYAYSDPMKTGR